jgi:hypothetical protein
MCAYCGGVVMGASEEGRVRARSLEARVLSVEMRESPFAVQGGVDGEQGFVR